MRKLLWAILAALILHASPAAAACAPTFPFCQKLPDRSDPNRAIFLGVVKQVTWPAPHPPAPPQREPGAAITDSRRKPGEPLPPLARRYPMVRFQVIEAFVNIDPGEFSARITSDFFVNDIPGGGPYFVEGETWLVEAYRHEPDFQWTTSTCARTKPIQQAEEDLRVLRAWVAGQRLPGYAAGRLFGAGGKGLAGARVYLRGDKQTPTAMTDEQGHFLFENLDPGVYEAVAVAPGAGMPVKIDLTNSWCWQGILRVAQ